MLGVSKNWIKRFWGPKGRKNFNYGTKHIFNSKAVEFKKCYDSQHDHGSCLCRARTFQSFFWSRFAWALWERENLMFSLMFCAMTLCEIYPCIGKAVRKWILHKDFTGFIMFDGLTWSKARKSRTFITFHLFSFQCRCPVIYSVVSAPSLSWCSFMSESVRASGRRRERVVGESKGCERILEWVTLDGNVRITQLGNSEIKLMKTAFSNSFSVCSRMGFLDS